MLWHISQASAPTELSPSRVTPFPLRATLKLIQLSPQLAGKDKVNNATIVVLVIIAIHLRNVIVIVIIIRKTLSGLTAGFVPPNSCDVCACRVRSV